MKGKYKITANYRKAKYTVVLSRMITVIEDVSGRGKSKFTKAVESGTYACPVPIKVVHCRTGDESAALSEITESRGRILIFDDPANFVNETQFVEVIQKSGCYVIFISHDKVQQYTYSIKDIYKFVCTDKHSTLQPKYKEVMKTTLDLPEKFRVVTEDSGTGYEMVRSYHFDTESAGGRDNVINKVRPCQFYLVDGAAFGANVKRVLAKILDMHTAGVLCMPESFEYTILVWTSVRKLLFNACVPDATTDCDFDNYLTYEQFYTDVLKSAVIGYNKHNLTKYLNNDAVKHQYIEALEKYCGVNLRDRAPLTSSQLNALKELYPVAYNIYVTGGDMLDVQAQLDDIKNRYQ
ncbi:MAG: hypothetical protein NC548_11370 [Lachnospiraceae bacterium]|nr:hypothetical protein [Lachnospiraceae bacterium]